MVKGATADYLDKEVHALSISICGTMPVPWWRQMNSSIPSLRCDCHRVPRAVRVIEHTLIPLRDGTTLAARIWLPQDAEQNPVPAILEYLPYRKRDGTYERDALTHPYLAGHGYAGTRRHPRHW